MIYSNFTAGITRAEIIQDGFASLVNCDIHSNPGKLQSSWAMVKDSGTTVTELCKNAVVVSNGDSFWFSSETGKIWKRTYAGVWSLVYTTTTGPTTGAALYNGYLYFSTYKSSNNTSYLGRISEALASSEASWTSTSDGWQTFLTPKTFQSMVLQNLKLYIGDSPYIASVDASGTFVNNALDLPPNQASTALYPYESDLVVGAIVQDNFSKCGVFRWDTVSDSWTVEDYVMENGVDMFIPIDNGLLAMIGIDGGIFEYTGAKMQRIMKLRDADRDMANSTTILAQGSCNLYGKPCINHKFGIFTLYRNDDTFVNALNIEYVSSAGRSVTPGAIKPLELAILSSWKTDSSAGVDKLSTTTRANAILTTPIFNGEAHEVIVKYSSLPAGTSIGIETKVDSGTWTAQTAIVDSINKVVYFDGGLGDVSTVQARITLTSSGSSTPIIEYVEIR